MKRREFLKSAVTTGAGLILLPGGLRANAASNKLNIALIGTWGRGLAHFDSIADENVVALCDCWSVIWRTRSNVFRRRRRTLTGGNA